MNTRRLTGDMADQVNRDREELVEMRAKCERLEAHFAALKEASIKFTDEIWAHIPEEQWNNPPVLKALEKLQAARAPLHGTNRKEKS